MKQLGIPLLLALSLVSAKGANQVKANQINLEKPSAFACALMVPNAVESARWYEENLGFSKVRTSDEPNGVSRVVLLEQKGAILEIMQVHDSFAFDPAVSKGPRNRLRGIQKFGFLVEKDVFDRIHRNLEEKKASFVGGLFTDDGMKMRTFIVEDHDGNMVQFYARV